MRQAPLTGAGDRGPAGLRAAAGLQLAPAAVLGNGRYRLLVTAAGTGASHCDGYALTRWRSDPIEDRDGFFVYLRDLDDGTLGSIGAEPAGPLAARARTAWQPGRFDIAWENDGVEARMEICVAPDVPLEIRRVTLRNTGQRTRRLELCSFIEVVLNDPAAHAAHPAFSNLFVQTEWVRESRALLAHRRPRANDERHPWLVHALLGDGPVEHESDRARFVGRGRRLAAPAALSGAERLSGTTGNVLDPALCLRQAIELPAGASATLAFVLGCGESRDAALANVASVREPAAVDDVFARAASHDREALAAAGLTEAQGARLHATAGALLYGDPALRATPDVLARASGPSTTLAALEPDGDAPWILLDALIPAAARALPEVLAAQRYWGSLGLRVRLLVLAEEPTTVPRRDDPEPSVHVVKPSDLGADERDRIACAASWVVNGESLPVGAIERCEARPRAPKLEAQRTAGADRHATARPTEPLQFFNGHGGFSADGREYVILLRQGEAVPSRPPSPWVNVIANEQFGCLVSESGAGTTWSMNSREHRLTPWSNDPVLDPHGEAIYLRDEDTGEFWSVMPGPVPAGDYELRHGLGATRCRHTSHELEHDARVFVARHDPIKFVQIRLTDASGRARRLSLFAYHRLVLGTTPEHSGRFVVTSFDSEAGVLLARNRANVEYADRVAFAAAIAPAGATTHVSGDREAFLGRGGTVACPRALDAGATLDGRVGAGFDPCFAIQSVVELSAGGTLELSFLLGEGESESEIRAWLARYREPNAIARAFREGVEFWDDIVSAVRVETPSPAIDLMVNGWLAYQALSCRMWGRTAFYQSGGAFGFRDQLQDASGFAALHPDLLRAQIVLHAGHQFLEGDVLHWWHPPFDRGLRTRFADDSLWLPYLTAGYLQTTGDWSLLAERAPFLAARELADGEDEAFLTPLASGESGDVYEHCCRAIDRALEVGAHGLPKFGGGDWNDGMNRVGREGRGESVWMGFFLFAVLGDFAPVCERQGDRTRAHRYREHRDQLRAALNADGWDGAWYRRGFYDDGAILGSRMSDECQIDALVQAWSVISGAAPRARAMQALDEVNHRLVGDGIVRLLTPPFENTPHDPGYIKGYVRGVRENGGQYTHAALWVVRALAELGLSERAGPMLEMLSPIPHTSTPEQVETYRVEPYVIAADVYGEPPHVGRGGWTWYTGSAAWMMRVALESVLGVRMVAGNTLVIRPCIPSGWPSFRVSLRLPNDRSRYEITIRSSGGAPTTVTRALLDGASMPVTAGAARIPLVRDGGQHRVEIELGAVAVPPEHEPEPVRVDRRSAPEIAPEPGR